MLSDRMKILCDDYTDMSFVYSILCMKSSNYYGRIKYLVDFPVILISASLSIINSNLRSDNENDIKILRYLNISLNILSTVLIAINTIFKINEKKLIFKILSDKFTKISHRIEEHKILNKIDKHFISNTINSYETIVEGLEFDFPEHIKRSVRTQFKEIKTLPPIINNIKKLPKYRDIELLGIRSGNTSPDNVRNISLTNYIDNLINNNDEEQENISIDTLINDKINSKRNSDEENNFKRINSKRNSDEDNYDNIHRANSNEDDNIYQKRRFKIDDPKNVSFNSNSILKDFNRTLSTVSYKDRENIKKTKQEQKQEQEQEHKQKQEQEQEQEQEHKQVQDQVQDQVQIQDQELEINNKDNIPPKYDIINTYNYNKYSNTSSNLDLLHNKYS